MKHNIINSKLLQKTLAHHELKSLKGGEDPGNSYYICHCTNGTGINWEGTYPSAQYATSLSSHYCSLPGGACETSDPPEYPGRSATQEGVYISSSDNPL